MLVVRYALVPVPEWRGYIRLGTVGADEVLRFIEDHVDPLQKAEATLRFIMASILSGLGCDTKSLTVCAQLLGRRKSTAVLERLRAAAITLNDVNTDRFVYRKRLQDSDIRRFAHQLAAERHVIDVNEMLRSIDWSQLQELQAYAEIERIGDFRMDVRFALLASVVAGSAGAKDLSGNHYTADHFLKSMRMEAKKEQTTEEMELYLNTWCSAANRVYAESHGLR